MRYLIGVIIAMSGLMAGCSQSADKTEVSSSHIDEVNNLYSELKNVYKQYTDSVKLTEDSTSLMRIMDEFEEKVYNIYKRYPANLDKELSQGQNDTLWLLANEYIKVRDAHLRPVMSVVLSDSIPRDSVVLHNN